MRKKYKEKEFYTFKNYSLERDFEFYKKLYLSLKKANNHNELLENYNHEIEKFSVEDSGFIWKSPYYYNEIRNKLNSNNY